MSKKYIIAIVAVYCIIVAGCATSRLPTDNIPRYALYGTNYLPLAPVCDAQDIVLEYDPFTQVLLLSKKTHRLALRVGDPFALVDGQLHYFDHPAVLRDGTIIIPESFNRGILQRFFMDKPSLPAQAKVVQPSSIKRIVIDAGHGGKDPGAISASGLREKTVNLDIAKRLAKLLKDEGFSVYLTRSTDTFVPLSVRTATANSFKADLFISIHSNANRVRSMNGFEVYYVSPAVNDTERGFSAIGKEIPSVKAVELVSASPQLKATLWDMVYTHNRGESIQLGRLICRSVAGVLDNQILGLKGARYYVLRGTDMPALLIEVGFLSNSREERLLGDGLYRQRIAQGINEGIVRYVRELSFAEKEN
ncbi:MAG: hypothetical protein C4540_01580 [Candidatus Omnitrophota bacterium]|nr:MAG: hypothetical protein C4540_01580 [Candidatus Omnitrophota bacterium]